MVAGIALMNDWIKQSDSFLAMTGKEILQHSGAIIHQQAIEIIHTEYLKYKEKLKNRITRVEKDFIKQIDDRTKELKKKDWTYSVVAVITYTTQLSPTVV